MSTLPLLMPEPMARAAVAVDEASNDKAVSSMLAAAPKDPLAETLDALKRMPERIRPIAEALGRELFNETFVRLARENLADAGKAADRSRTNTMLAQAAKLEESSAVVTLSFAPWHLAGPELLEKIAEELELSGDFDCVARLLAGTKPMNLFVAAGETDDRLGYLKSVAALVKRIPVNQLVLDGELVEWLPESEFLDACNIIGLSPVCVGIAEREKAGLHSFMTASSVREGLRIVAVDTAGRRLEVTPQGAVLPLAPENQAPRAPAKPAVQRALSSTPAALPAQAPAAEEAAKPLAVGSSLSNRIAALRNTQVMRRARP